MRSFIFLIVVTSLGCHREGALSQITISTSKNAFPSLSAKPLNLGEVSAGKGVSGSIALINNSAASVTVVSVETSCPCLKTQSKPIFVDSNGTKMLDVYFDSSEEPDFAGKLSIEVKGKDKNGVTVFKTDVAVSVISNDKSQSEEHSTIIPLCFSCNETVGTGSPAKLKILH